MKNSEAAVESLPENFASCNEDFEKDLRKCPSWNSLY